MTRSIRSVPGTEGRSRWRSFPSPPRTLGRPVCDVAFTSLHTRGDRRGAPSDSRPFDVYSVPSHRSPSHSDGHSTTASVPADRRHTCVPVSGRGVGSLTNRKESHRSWPVQTGYSCLVDSGDLYSWSTPPCPHCRAPVSSFTCSNKRSCFRFPSFKESKIKFFLFLTIIL